VFPDIKRSRHQEATGDSIKCTNEAFLGGQATLVSAKHDICGLTLFWEVTFSLCMP